MDTARKASAQARKKAATVRRKRLSGATAKIIVVNREPIGEWALT